MNFNQIGLVAIAIILLATLSACVNQNDEAEEPGTKINAPLELMDINVKDGDILNSDKLEITGTTSGGGSVSFVDLDGNTLGSANTTESGNWIISLKELPDGEYTFKVVIESGDIASTIESSVYNIIIDTTPPTIPSFENILSSTQQLPAVLLGTSEPNATVELNINGEKVTTIQSDANGDWSFELSSLDVSDDEKLVLAVRAKDAAGNESNFAEIELQLTPNEPLTELIDKPTIDSISGDVINFSSLLLTGTATTDVTVSLLNGSVSIAENILVGDDGTWSFNFEGLEDGLYVISAVSQADDGNASNSSDALVFTVDLTPPVPPAITSNINESVNLLPQKLIGNGEAGATLELYLSTTGVEQGLSLNAQDSSIQEETAQLGSVEIGDNGTWEFLLSEEIVEMSFAEDGEYAFFARVLDNANNFSENSEKLEFILDRKAPQLLSPPRDTGKYIAISTLEFNWDEATEVMSGVEFYEIEVSSISKADGSRETYQIDKSNSAVSYTFDGASLGKIYFAQVRAIDFAGNVSEWSEESNGIEVIQFDPFVPDLQSVIDDRVAFNLTILNGADNQVTSIKLDKENNLLLAGYFIPEPGSGSDAEFSLDPNQTNVSSVLTGINCYLVKYDTDGEYLWSWSAKGDNWWQGGFSTDGTECHIKELIFDGIGNIYLVGDFTTPMYFDPDASLSDVKFDGVGYEFGFRNIFVTKLSSDGEYIWTKTFEGNLWDYMHDAAIDEEENIYLTGNFRSSNIDFDPSDEVYNLSVKSLNYDDVVMVYDFSKGWIRQANTSFGPKIGSDLFVVKLDKDGSLIWVNSIGSQYQIDDKIVTSHNSGQSIDINSSNDSVVLTGSFADVFDIFADPYDIASPSVTKVMSLNSSTGEIDWDLQIDARVTDVVRDAEGQFEGVRTASQVKTNSVGDIYVAGYFKGEATIDSVDVLSEPLLVDSAVSTNDIYLTKISSGGEFLQTYVIASSGDDRVEDIDIDENDQVFLTGVIGQAANVSILASEGNIDNVQSFGDKSAFIAKFDRNGKYLSTQIFQGTDGSSTEGKHITVQDNNIVSVGRLTGEANFDFGRSDSLAGGIGFDGYYFSRITLTPTLTDSYSYVTLGDWPTFTVPNQAPVIEPIPNQTCYVGYSCSFSIYVDDPDGDSVGVKVENRPYWAAVGYPMCVVGAPCPRLTIGGTPEQSGNYLIEIIATDNGEPRLSSTTSVNVNVLATSPPPTVVVLE